MSNTEKPKQQERFNKVMVPHMDVLYNYGLYLTGDREEANDLLQETYLKAFRFFEKFEPGTNAKAWLYRIMRNTFINEYRRVKRLPDIVQYDEQISAYQMLPREEEKTELRSQMDGELFEDEIAGAIAGLPEKFKSVIVLRDVQDLPYEEIADALEIPVGTVRSRLHRARAILFARLRDYATAKGYNVPDVFSQAEFAT
ncbi:MAG: polymerase sigma factor RpoE [Bacteroidetes bacterium]|nr:polymerase sigma factor RpoE [Bacteroidota bacterium]